MKEISYKKGLKIVLMITPILILITAFTLFTDLFWFRDVIGVPLVKISFVAYLIYRLIKFGGNSGN